MNTRERSSWKNIDVATRRRDTTHNQRHKYGIDNFNKDQKISPHKLVFHIITLISNFNLESTSQLLIVDTINLNIFKTTIVENATRFFSKFITTLISPILSLPIPPGLLGYGLHQGLSNCNPRTTCSLQRLI